MIQHCSFQSSIGQAIVLTEISGDVIIGYCMFVNNTRYRGHGTLIYYSSENMVSSAKNLVINNSTFQGNKGSSNVYLSASEHTRGYPIFFIENSTFIDNKNVTFYLLNHNVYCRSTLFKGNKEVFFGKNSDITFTENSEIHVFNSTIKGQPFSFLLDCSRVTFRGHSRVMFNYSARAIGLYNYSYLIFEDNSNITFSNINGNQVIYLQNHSSVTFEGNSTVSFINNSFTYGGTMYSKYRSSITFQGSSTVLFNNNRAINGGGGIFSQDGSCIAFQGSSTVTFNNNRATNRGRGTGGGAIFSQDDSSITFQGSSTVTFSHNKLFLKAELYFHKIIVVLLLKETLKYLSTTMRLLMGELCISKIVMIFKIMPTSHLKEILMYLLPTIKLLLEVEHYLCSMSVILYLKGTLKSHLGATKLISVGELYTHKVITALYLKEILMYHLTTTLLLM